MTKQGVKNWVASPLGVNLLLSLVKGRQAISDKYFKICSGLKSNESFVITNKIFHSPTYDVKAHITNICDTPVESKEVDFNDFSDTVGHIRDWINQYEAYSEIDTKATNAAISQNISNDLLYVLMSLTMFRGALSGSTSNLPVMKTYNSFSYTQDTSYEARLLELPMKDPEFKLVVVVPNESDLVHTLFRRLINEGFTAAVNSLQPLFTVTSALNAPSIKICSETGISLDLQRYARDLVKGNIVQYGCVRVDSSRATIKVLSCLYSTRVRCTPLMDDKTYDIQKPFFFAITFMDTPIFIGQYSLEDEGNL